VAARRCSTSSGLDAGARHRLVVVSVIRPGAGFNVDPATLNAGAVADYAKRATSQSTADFLLHIIPSTFIDAFTGSGDLLQCSSWPSCSATR